MTHQIPSHLIHLLEDHGVEITPAIIKQLTEESSSDKVVSLKSSDSAKTQEDSSNTKEVA